MSVLDKYKEWYSLEDTAKRFSKKFGEDVTVKDVLRLCIDKELNLSIMLRNTQAIEELQYCPLADSFKYIYEAASNLGALDCLEVLRYGIIDDDLDSGFGWNLRDYSLKEIEHLRIRVEAIKGRAEDLFIESKGDDIWGVSALPEVVYGPGHAELHLCNHIELRVLDGVYPIVMSDLQNEAMLDMHVIANEELLTEDYEYERLIVLDANHNKCTLVGVTIKASKDRLICGGTYSFQKGLPDVDMLLIQTKDLVSFEKTNANESCDQKPIEQPCTEETIIEKPDDLVKEPMKGRAARRITIGDLIINPNTNKPDKYLEFIECAEDYLRKTEYKVKPNALQLWKHYEKMGFKLLKREGFKIIFKRVTNPKKPKK